MAKINTIHPSKPPKIINQAVSPMTKIPQEVQIESNKSGESSESSESSEYSPDQVLNKRTQKLISRYWDKIFKKAHKSARKAADICQTIRQKAAIFQV